MADPHSGSELWRDCVKWLKRCGVMDKNTRVEYLEMADFAQMLRDGVLLCQLANQLSRGSIDMQEITLRPFLSQFLCLKNISQFLKACQDVFGLKPSELFEAEQLYKVSDFGKVLRSLSKLSQCSVALKSGISGFGDAIEEASDYYNQVVYQHLEETLDAREPTEDEYNDIVDEGREKIYDVIVTRPRPSDEELKPKDKRQHCLREIIDTEKNYVDALNNILLKRFYSPLRDVLKPDEHKTVFMNLPEIATLHTAFHSELGKAVRVSFPTSSSSAGQPRLGEVFVRWKNKFVIYSEFCVYLERAVGRVDTLCHENYSVRQKIQECEKEANGGKFRLQDLLSVPMQRILKYHLLLRELSKHTPKPHPERESTELALDAMLDLSLYLNEVKRDSEMLRQIDFIEASITDLQMPENTKLSDYGRLLKDDDVRVQTSDDKRIKSRYLFVFDKVIMICKSIKANSYTYKSALVLSEYDVEDCEGNNNGSTSLRGSFIKSSQKWSHSWSLVKGDVVVLVIYCKSKEAKDSWLKTVELAKDNVFPQAKRKSDHAFHMHTFDEPTECRVCQKLLKGKFFQGYKCQQCDQAVHKGCIAGSEGCGQSFLPPRPGSMPIMPGLNFQDPMSGVKVRAVKAFHGSGYGPNYLAFAENELIEVISSFTQVEGFWSGRLLSGRIGMFPADHVRRSRVLPNRTSSTRLTTVEDITPPDGAAPSFHHERSPSLDTPGSRIGRFPSDRQPASPQSREYINLDHLECYPWFGGRIDRPEAQERLQGLPSGTFMIRYSDQQARHVISLCYADDVKHLKIENTLNGFYLDTNRYFSSIVELVQYFEQNSLQESFQGLDATLKVPITVAFTGFAVALHNFEGTAPNMLSLSRNDRVMILNKNGGDRGWWKGKVVDRGVVRIGYFPLAYVRELDLSPAR